jgi:hypothetical protein
MRASLVPVLLALLPAAGLAQPVVEGTMPLGAQVLALPPGPWRVLHQAAEPGRSTDGNFPTTMHRAVLVQERGGKAAAVVIANAGVEVGGAWNPHGICVNGNAVQREIVQAIRGALDCRGVVVIGSGRGATTPGYLDALYDEGTRRPGWIPARWLSAQVIQSERMHYLSVEYRYAPEVFVPRAAMRANWNAGARDAVQEEAVQQLAAFAGTARAALQRGLYGRQPASPLAAPF